MNQEELFELVLRAQSEDTDAMEQLLLHTYTPVSWLCRKLLQDPQAAAEQTADILKTVFTRLHTLQDPQQYNDWFCRITAARCAQILPQLLWGSTARTSEAPQEAPMPEARELTQEETVLAVSNLVDTLPEEARTCILLCCCAGMNSKTISQVAGYAQISVREHLALAQQQLQEKLDACQQQGTVFTGITSLQEILRSAMYQIPEGQDPIPTVYGILGKEIPIPPDPEKELCKRLAIVAAVLVVLNLLAAGVLMLVFRSGVLPLEPIPTAAPIAAPTEETVAPTTEATEETTVPTTEATEEATEPVTVPVETKAQPASAPTVAPAPAPTQPAASQPTTAAPSTEATSPEKTGEDGHTHNFKTYSAANCETGGTRRHTCTVCEYTYIEELQPTGSHSFTIVPTGSADATCTTAGKAAKICTKCNYAVNVDDPNKPALGHNYESTVVTPTSTERGYTLHKCSRCGDSYQDTFVDPVIAPPAAPETTAPET